MANAIDPRIRHFEDALDAALQDRAAVAEGGNEALVLAANVVEFANTEFSPIADRVMHGLEILAPRLIGRAGDEVPIETLISDLEFAGHYWALRELLYYSYSAPGSIDRRFNADTISASYKNPSVRGSSSFRPTACISNRCKPRGIRRPAHGYANCYAGRRNFS